MKYIDTEKLIDEIKGLQCEQGFEDGMEERGYQIAIKDIFNIIDSLQQEQPSLPTIKGWIARDDADRLGLYDQKPTRKTEPGVFSGIANSWVIGDTWIGRFSLDQTAKTLFPNLCWKDDPIEVEFSINKK